MRASRTVSDFFLILVGPSNTIDNRVFWYTQYFMAAFWVLFAVISVFTLSLANLTVCIVSALLTIINLMGYIRCDKNHQQKVSGLITSKAAAVMSRENLLRFGMMASSMRGSVNSNT